MDRFGVPNKVNRHVIKALKTIYRKKGSNQEETATFSEIFSEVKQSMRNLRPVINLSGCVRKSLRNMEKSNMGIFRKKGPKIAYNIAPNTSKPSVSFTNENSF